MTMLPRHSSLVAIGLALCSSAACGVAEDDGPLDDSQQAVSGTCASWYCGASCPARQTCDGGAFGLSCSDATAGTCVMSYGPYEGDRCWGLYAQGTNYGDMGDRPDLMISTFDAFVEGCPCHPKCAIVRSFLGIGGSDPQALCDNDCYYHSTYWTEGWIDSVSCSGVSGWVWDTHWPDWPLTVEIYSGSTVLATIPADDYRADLAAAGKGDGYHGFSWSGPVPDGTHSIGVRVIYTSYDLPNSGWGLTCGGAECGNGVCEAGEYGGTCGSDCCDYDTPCGATYMNEGVYYCRSMNGGAYRWYTAWSYQGSPSVQPYCDDSYDVGSSTYACGGDSGTCCSVPNGWVSGSCAGGGGGGGGMCSGSCGGYSSANGCYCDAACVTYGDCCSDGSACSVCGHC